jgi:hypothetical protein
MAGFIYGVANDQRPVTPEKASKWGLGYAFTGTIENRPVNGNTRWGSAGNVFLDTDRHKGFDAGVYLDRQTWRKLPTVEGRPELWVGYWNDAKPGPEDLQRPAMLPGEVAMVLGDGNRWVIPTLTEFDAETKSGECSLPAPLDYDDDGNLFTTKPVGEYGELWDAVHPVALGVCFGSNDDESEIREPSDKEIKTAAFRLLTANYVVSMPELVMLKCLRNDATFRTIVLASCRGEWLMEAINELSKKNDAPIPEDGSDLTDGQKV